MRRWIKNLMHSPSTLSKNETERGQEKEMESLSSRCGREVELPPMKKKKKKRGGCEIEARGISYKIYTSNRRNPFKIWSRDDEDDEEQEKEVIKVKEKGHLKQQLSSIEEGVEEDEENGRKRKWRREPGETQVRHVLKNVSCRAKPWELLAIVGPSGAGKSTLLEILAGKLMLPPSPPALFVNQKPVDKAKFRKISGYVTQKDILFPLLTVRETLLFSAQLRLRLPSTQLTDKVDSLIKELGLEHVSGARVGDDRVRGISGGERRRVSIGVEVVHDPRVLILDEPTSGLDSNSALQIIDMLKAMAEVQGRTVVLSIHQPGFRIVKLFNSVLLLANGSVLHHGTVDQLQTHLRSAGLEAPPHANVVEFAMDSVEALQHQQRQQARKKGGNRCTLQQLFEHTKVADDETGGARGSGTLELCCGGYANSWAGETAILTHRYLKNVFRTKELFACRTIQMLVSGLVLGSIFYNLDESVAAAQERVGLFAFILTFLLSCTTEALPIFLQEREILMKETSSGNYRVSSYVVANGLVFLPFLLILSILFSVPLYWLVGLNRSFTAFAYFLLLIWLILYTANSVVVCVSSVAPNFIAGNSMVNGVMGSFFLFSGYFIRKEGMPSYWVFMHYISLFKYPFEGFLVNEFSDKCLDYRSGVCLVDGEHVLKEVGLGEESRWRNVAIMVGLILLYRFLSYLFLKCRCRCAQKGGIRRALV